jgi:hypothetical protein
MIRAGGEPMPSLITVVKLSALVIAVAAVSASRTSAQGAVSLDVACDQGPILGARDTLRNCTFIIHNGGTTPIRAAQLAFQPSNNAPVPDRYFFFREWLDGAEQPSPGVATIFDAGDIAPGASREIRFQIIVRSDHAFAADAVVLGAPNQQDFARTTIATSVDRSFSPQPARLAELLIVPKFIGEQAGTVQYRLRPSNESDDQLRNVTVEIEGAGGALLTSGDAVASPERHGPNEPLTTRLADIAPQTFVETLLTFKTQEACAYVSPAAVVRADAVSGGQQQSVTLAALAVEGYSLNCADGGGDYDLPVSGTGSAEDATRPGAWPMILLALGAVMTGAGTIFRRRRERLRAADMA